MQLIDTHAHLDSSEYNQDRVEVIERAKKVGIGYIVDVGGDLASSHRALELSQFFPEIFATVGVHPHDADQLNENALKILRDLAKADRVVAIGEIGLDYYYDDSLRDLQKEAFRKQLRLAREIGLPVVIHSREAEQDLLKILKEEKIAEIGGILHCFNSSLEMARVCIEEFNLYLGFGGMFTFKNAGGLVEVVREIPLSRILIETDSPYLTPCPYRGKRNEPAYVRLVAEKIAEIKGISLEEVAKITTANAKQVYNLDI